MSSELGYNAENIIIPAEMKTEPIPVTRKAKDN
jgi:hypothetical protein